MSENFFIKFISVSLWSIGVCVGMLAIFRYENTPGLKGDSPIDWPSNSKIERAMDYQLILFAHPHCPCTIASLEELKVILTKAPNLRTLILLVLPKNSDYHWFETDIWSKAKSIPHVSVMADVGGVESKHFGIKTSGHTLLYDPEGNLLFSGGITSSRGHMGSNMGSNSLLGYATSKCYTEETCMLKSTPVFGCPLIE